MRWPLACLLLAGCAASSGPSPGDDRRLPALSDRGGGLAVATEPGGRGSRRPPTESALRIESTRPGPKTTGPTPTWSPGELLFTRYSALLVEQELPLVIYLPPGYQRTPGRLPAIYLLHGIGYDEQQWVELGVLEQVDRRIAARVWEPLLLIMPLIPDPLLSSTDGGPESYEAEFLDGLRPYVQRTFRTDPERSALAGISRGGVWALEIALRHPTSFTGVAALSPALHINFPRPEYDPAGIAAQAGRFPPVIYLDAGEREPRTREAVQEFSELLRAQGVEHTLHLGPGGHDQEYWSSVALRALTMLVEGFR